MQQTDKKAPDEPGLESLFAVTRQAPAQGGKAGNERLATYHSQAILAAAGPQVTV
ncbi:MAG TPA: hypothetical protein VJM48_08995 [Methylibium sp.]|nr:hypothetical protein [Methylibium sp.]